ncbi:hypothetical protein JW933_01230, partial [candidate division FCPU426 bacterium]|nr:hypothetical protein [candidate division FCPU426 bacterium]
MDNIEQGRDLRAVGMLATWRRGIWRRIVAYVLTVSFLFTLTGLDVIFAHAFDYQPPRPEDRQDMRRDSSISATNPEARSGPAAFVDVDTPGAGPVDTRTTLRDTSLNVLKSEYGDLLDSASLRTISERVANGGNVDLLVQNLLGGQGTAPDPGSTPPGGPDPGATDPGGDGSDSIPLSLDRLDMDLADAYLSRGPGGTAGSGRTDPGAAARRGGLPGTEPGAGDDTQAARPPIKVTGKGDDTRDPADPTARAVRKGDDTEPDDVGEPEDESGEDSTAPPDEVVDDEEVTDDSTQTADTPEADRPDTGDTRTFERDIDFYLTGRTDLRGDGIRVGALMGRDPGTGGDDPDDTRVSPALARSKTSGTAPEPPDDADDTGTPPPGSEPEPDPPVQNTHSLQPPDAPTFDGRDLHVPPGGSRPNPAALRNSDHPVAGAGAGAPTPPRGPGYRSDPGITPMGSVPGSRPRNPDGDDGGDYAGPRGATPGGRNGDNTIHPTQPVDDWLQNAATRFLPAFAQNVDNTNWDSIVHQYATQFDHPDSSPPMSGCAKFMTSTWGKLVMFGIGVVISILTFGAGSWVLLAIQIAIQAIKTFIKLPKWLSFALSVASAVAGGWSQGLKDAAKEIGSLSVKAVEELGKQGLSELKTTIIKREIQQALFKAIVKEALMMVVSDLFADSGTLMFLFMSTLVDVAASGIANVMSGDGNLLDGFKDSLGMTADTKKDYSFGDFLKSQLGRELVKTVTEGVVACVANTLGAGQAMQSFLSTVIASAACSMAYYVAAEPEGGRNAKSFLANVVVPTGAAGAQSGMGIWGTQGLKKEGYSQYQIQGSFISPIGQFVNQFAPSYQPGTNGQAGHWGSIKIIEGFKEAFSKKSEQKSGDGVPASVANPANTRMPERTDPQTTDSHQTVLDAPIEADASGSGTSQSGSVRNDTRHQETVKPASPAVSQIPADTPAATTNRETTLAGSPKPDEGSKPRQAPDYGQIPDNKEMKSSDRPKPPERVADIGSARDESKDAIERRDDEVTKEGDRIADTDGAGADANQERVNENVKALVNALVQGDQGKALPKAFKPKTPKSTETGRSKPGSQEQQVKTEKCSTRDANMPQDVRGQVDKLQALGVLPGKGSKSVDLTVMRYEGENGVVTALALNGKLLSMQANIEGTKTTVTFQQEGPAGAAGEGTVKASIFQDDKKSGEIKVNGQAPTVQALLDQGRGAAGPDESGQAGKPLTDGSAEGKPLAAAAAGPGQASAQGGLDASGTRPEGAVERPAPAAGDGIEAGKAEGAATSAPQGRPETASPEEQKTLAEQAARGPAAAAPKLRPGQIIKPAPGVAVEGTAAAAPDFRITEVSKEDPTLVEAVIPGQPNTVYELRTDAEGHVIRQEGRYIIQGSFLTGKKAIYIPAGSTMGIHRRSGNVYDCSSGTPELVAKGHTETHGNQVIRGSMPLDWKALPREQQRNLFLASNMEDLSTADLGQLLAPVQQYAGQLAAAKPGAPETGKIMRDLAGLEQKLCAENPTPDNLAAL